MSSDLAVSSDLCQEHTDEPSCEHDRLTIDIQESMYMVLVAFCAGDGGEHGITREAFPYRASSAFALSYSCHCPFSLNKFFDGEHLYVIF